jgi:Phospholipase/Carboxylesterase
VNHNLAITYKYLVEIGICNKLESKGKSIPGLYLFVNILKMKLMKTGPFFFLFSCFILGILPSLFSQTALFSYEKFVNSKGDTLKYRLHFPDADTLRKFPLVIFLHGAGERGSDNEAQLKWGVMNFVSDQNMKLHPALVIAPQCPEKTDWANFTDRNPDGNMVMEHNPGKTMKLLSELIEQFIKKFPVDTNRIYITGLSLGDLELSTLLNDTRNCLQLLFRFAVVVIYLRLLR